MDSTERSFEPDRSSLPSGFEFIPGQPENAVDPWWMGRAFDAGYQEFLYRRWPIEDKEIEPSILDGRFPGGIEVVRRAGFLNSGKVEAVLESDEGMALLEIEVQGIWTSVAARSQEDARTLLEAVETAFPHAEPQKGGPSIVLGIWSGTDGGSCRFHSREVEPWRELADSYAPATRRQLESLIGGFTPGAGGQLIIWHGPPGTGKSFALATLVYEWREWASANYIADPEVLLGQPEYLFDVMFGRDLRSPEWRLVILEDSGELFGADAKSQTGQGLSRLLNASDGMLGHGAKTLFLITTNEPVGSFHPAIVRPGRCAARVEFHPLPVDGARAWLVARGGADQAKSLENPATLAQLYGFLRGEQPMPERRVGFQVGFGEHGGQQWIVTLSHPRGSRSSCASLTHPAGRAVRAVGLQRPSRLSRLGEAELVGLREHDI